MEIPGQPEEEPQLLDAEIRPGQEPVPLAGVGGFDQGLQHVQSQALDTVPE